MYSTSLPSLTEHLHTSLTLPWLRTTCMTDITTNVQPIHISLSIHISHRWCYFNNNNVTLTCDKVYLHMNRKLTSQNGTFYQALSCIFEIFFLVYYPDEKYIRIIIYTQIPIFLYLSIYLLVLLFFIIIHSRIQANASYTYISVYHIKIHI